MSCLRLRLSRRRADAAAEDAASGAEASRAMP